MKKEDYYLKGSVVPKAGLDLYKAGVLSHSSALVLSIRRNKANRAGFNVFTINLIKPKLP